MAPRELLDRAAPVARVAALFTLVALLTSRFVLLGHEFFGHGAAAMLVGGEVIDHRLFLFGGGWVITRTPSLSMGDALLVSLGGVVLELIVAAALIWVGRSRERSVAVRVAALGAAGLCLIHVGVYIGLGTHYGYGDGRLLHQVLGSYRAVVVGVGCALAVGSSFWLAARLRSLLAPTFRQSGVWLVAGLLASAALAGALHGSLMLAERTVRSDPTYAEIMREEAERKARRMVASEADRRRALGRPMSDEERKRRARAIAAAESPTPIRVPLYIAIGLAAMVAALRAGRRPAEAELGWSQLVPLALLTALAIALVAVLHAPWWR